MDKNSIRNRVIELASIYLCFDENVFMEYISKYDIVSSIVSWAYHISLNEEGFTPIENLHVDQKREIFNSAKALRTNFKKDRIVKICESLYFRQIAYDNPLKK